MKKIAQIALALVVTSSLQADPKWQYDAELYMLFPNMTGDMTVGPLRAGRSNKVIPIDADPSDVFGALKMGAMGHFEAVHQNNWGLWLDYAFMDLSGDEDRKVIEDISFYQGVFEGFATYKKALGVGSLDYYGGVRWWHNKFDLSTIGRDSSRTIDWYDPVIGVRYNYPLNDAWLLRGRADIGGFSLGAKSSYCLAIAALYSINENWQIDMQYKGLWVDYEEGSSNEPNYFRYDNLTHGVILGINYKF